MYSPSISDLIIASLFSGRSTRTFRSILREREFEQSKKESVQVTFSRLHKKGLIASSPAGWTLTKDGRQRAKIIAKLSYIPSPFKKDTAKSVIIAFDIPERERILRNWLRNQIKNFGFTMLQQSLWFGPGPLPKSFIKRLETLHIRTRVKIFSGVKKLN